MTIYVIVKPTKGAPYVQEFSSCGEIKKECIKLHPLDVERTDKLIWGTSEYLQIMYGGLNRYVLLATMDGVLQHIKKYSNGKNENILLLLGKIAYLKGKEEEKT